MTINILLIYLLIYLLSFLPTLYAAFPSLLNDTNTNATQSPQATTAAHHCAIAYYNNIPSYVQLEANTCGVVHPNPDVKVVRAQNGDCVTCWFYT